jgi:hypothetical protein
VGKNSKKGVFHDLLRCEKDIYLNFVLSSMLALNCQKYSLIRFFELFIIPPSAKRPASLLFLFCKSEKSKVMLIVSAFLLGYNNFISMLVCVLAI